MLTQLLALAASAAVATGICFGAPSAPPAPPCAPPLVYVPALCVCTQIGEQSIGAASRLSHPTKLEKKESSLAAATQYPYHMMPDSIGGAANSLSAVLLPDYTGMSRKSFLSKQQLPLTSRGRFNRKRKPVVVPTPSLLSDDDLQSVIKMERMQILRESWRMKRIAAVKAKLLKAANLVSKSLWNRYAFISPDSPGSSSSLVAGDLGTSNYIVNKRNPYGMYSISSSIKGAQQSNSFSKISRGSKVVLGSL